MQYPVISVEETGKRIKEICDTQGIRAKDIREYMNFAAMQSVYDWFRGKNLPSLDNLYALSRLLGVTVDSLIVASDQKDRTAGAEYPDREKDSRLSEYQRPDRAGHIGLSEYELTGARCLAAVRILMPYVHFARRGNSCM